MKKVGLALGGGSAKGFSHIGVLEVLEKHKIPINYIAGTSMGAVVGALYAAGFSIAELKKISTHIKWEELMDFTLPDRGILSGEKIELFLRKLLKNKRFKDLEIPLAVVAADVNKGEKVIFKSGDVSSALRASISIPSIFVPCTNNNRLLVDGSVLDPVPVDVARQMGADVVIAVNLFTQSKNVVLNSKFEIDKEFFSKIEKQMIEQEIEQINKYISKKNKKLPWIVRNVLEHPKMFIEYIKKHKLRTPEVLKVTSNSFNMMSNELGRHAVMSADYAIRPELSKYSRFDFTKASSIIKSGRKATEECINEIKSLVK